MSDGESRSDHFPPTLGELARSILQAQAAGEPITLAISSKGRMAVGDPRSIRQLHEMVDHLESVDNPRRSFAEVEAGGRADTLDEVLQEWKAEHGAPQSVDRPGPGRTHRPGPLDRRREPKKTGGTGEPRELSSWSLVTGSGGLMKITLDARLVVWA